MPSLASFNDFLYFARPLSYIPHFVFGVDAIILCILKLIPWYTFHFHDLQTNPLNANTVIL